MVCREGVAKHGEKMETIWPGLFSWESCTYTHLCVTGGDTGAQDNMICLKAHLSESQSRLGRISRLPLQLLVTACYVPSAVLPAGDTRW